ncbi:MAG TPA: T9SS type A sorting domain-containing protein [Bacteroidetes bacterium]|nr:T9SS type A sorting domain-containing protein [Bacteroidota bacterium]
MKKSFYFLAALLFSFSLANAQITITADDITPINVVAEQTVDENPAASILEGATGNQSWDFSELAEGAVTTFAFLAPGNSPFPNSFPEANLASKQDTSIYVFMVMDDDKIQIIGAEGLFETQGLEVEGKLDFVPGQSLIRFPATFGDAYDEQLQRIAQIEGATINIPSFDSVRLVTSVQRSVKIDAYGQMTTPTGTFETLRSSETEISQNDLFALAAGNWSLFQSFEPDTVITYNWWGNEDNKAFPIVQLEYTLADGSRKATWLKGFVTSVSDLPAIDFQLFPNPAQDYLVVNLPEPVNGQCDVYDLNGRILISKKLSGNELRLELKSIGPGHYYLVLKDGANSVRGLKKFEIMK